MGLGLEGFRMYGVSMFGVLGFIGLEMLSWVVKNPC